MPVRTSVALVAAAFLGFASVAEANNVSTEFRQVEGFSFHYGPQGQYFGSGAPLPRYGTYDYSPSRSVHRNHSKGTVPPTK